MLCAIQQFSWAGACTRQRIRRGLGCVEADETSNSDPGALLFKNPGFQGWGVNLRVLWSQLGADRHGVLGVNWDAPGVGRGSRQNTESAIWRRTGVRAEIWCKGLCYRLNCVPQEGIEIISPHTPVNADLFGNRVFFFFFWLLLFFQFYWDIIDI